MTLGQHDPRIHDVIARHKKSLTATVTMSLLKCDNNCHPTHTPDQTDKSNYHLINQLSVYNNKAHRQSLRLAINRHDILANSLPI